MTTALKRKNQGPPQTNIDNILHPPPPLATTSSMYDPLGRSSRQVQTYDVHDAITLETDAQVSYKIKNVQPLSERLDETCFQTS